MGKELEVSCAKPTGTTVDVRPSDKPGEEQKEQREEKIMVSAGKKAPGFTAPAFHEGTFTQIDLSDYLGKWILLCFYPGDFTFV